MNRWKAGLLFSSMLFIASAKAQATADNAAPVVCNGHCQVFGPATAGKTVIFLHGASGPAGYDSTAKRLADAGYFVIFPHFLEVKRTREATDDASKTWAAFVSAIADEEHQHHPRRPIIAFGISLGASVALAAATKDQNIAAAVDWAGSMPDEAFHTMKRLPPLLILHGTSDSNVPVINAQQLIRLCDMVKTQCESHLYKGEGHVFPGEREDAWQRTLKFLETHP